MLRIFHRITNRPSNTFQTLERWCSTEKV